MQACRTCLSRHDLCTFGDVEFSGDQLFEATGVKILQNDGLSQAVCQYCVKSIANILNFREIASKVDKYFRTTASHLKVKTELNNYQDQDVMVENLMTPCPIFENENSLNPLLDVENHAVVNNQNDHNFILESEEQSKFGKNTGSFNIKQESLTDCYANNQVTIEIDNIPFQYRPQSTNDEPTNQGLTSLTNHITKRNENNPTKINLLLQKLYDAKHNKKSKKQRATSGKSSQSKDYLSKSVDNSILGDEKKSLLNNKPGIIGQRKNYIKKLVNNLNERKAVLLTAHKMIKQKLALHEQKVKVENEIVKPKQIPNTTRYRHWLRNKKLREIMSLAVSGYKADGPVQCRLCRKLMRNMRSFRQHAATHFHPEYTCQVCGKSFHQKTQLNRHQQAWGHGAEKQFLCTHCNYRAADRSCIRNHIRAAHTGEKPYECNECGMKFRMRTNIMQHMHKHFGLKDIQCEQCPARFNRKAELWTHKQRAHLNIVTTHHCYICPRSFTHVKNARDHIQKVHGIHTDQQQHIYKVKSKRLDTES